MKKLFKTITLKLTIVALLLGSVSTVSIGQAPQAALAAEIAVPFGSAAGNVVLHDDYLLFTDTEQPGGSFALQRSDIVGIMNESGFMVIRTSKMFRSRGGENTRLNVKFVAPESGALLEQWFRASKGAAAPATAMASASPMSAPTSAGSANVAATGNTAFLSYEVTTKKFIGRDGRGKLFFTKEKIVYESINDLERSRQWEWRDIKEMKRGNPYQLKLVPFAGDAYDFLLVGTPMDNSQYKDIVDRVTNARLSAK